MNRFLILFLFFASYALGLVVCSTVMNREDPLRDTSQMILVIAETDTSTTASLALYNRTEGEWDKALSHPVVIGRSGFAWGRGIHRTDSIPAGERIKREGDGAAPQGAFKIMGAWGYLPPEEVNTMLSYTQSTEDLVWVDEPESRLYNRPANLGDLRNPPPSHEKMIRDDGLYKYVIFVGHNAVNIRRGAGSCIFLHIAREDFSPTAGCTAMTEEEIVRLLGLLDEDKTPLIVQLTQKNYDLFRDDWGLP